MQFIKDISEFIFLKDTLQTSDIIFIPGGSYPELGEYAAEVWKQGLAPLVMPSGGVSIKTGKFNGVKSRIEIYNKAYKTECEFLVDVLTINGVDQEAIIEESTSGYTKANALNSRIILDQKGIKIKKAILCCKSFHARRALTYYQMAFPDTTFYVHPFPYVEKGVLIDKETWFQTEAGIKRVLGEVERCGAQFMDDLIEYVKE